MLEREPMRKESASMDPDAIAKKALEAAKANGSEYSVMNLIAAEIQGGRDFQRTKELAVEALVRQLAEAVEIRLARDVPIGTAMELVYADVGIRNATDRQDLSRLIPKMLVRLERERAEAFKAKAERLMNPGAAQERRAPTDFRQRRRNESDARRASWARRDHLPSDED